MTEAAPTVTAAAPPPVASPPAGNTGAGQSRTVALAILGIIALLLGLHLVADRLTPYTDQARVRVFVVPIAPEVSGTVRRVHVVNNQLVKAGDPLFTLGDESYLIAATKAQADIDAVYREQQSQDAAIEVSLANLRAAEADLERDAKDNARLESIWQTDKGAISLRRLEISRASLAGSQSRVASARAQVTQARAARGATGANNDRLVAARSALEKAQLDIRRTTVFAPADGLVTDMATEVGDYAGPGTQVMTFIAATDVWIEADMTENNIGRIKRGAPAEILLDVLPGRVLAGRVRSIGFGVNAGSGARAGNPLPTVQTSKDFLRSSQRFPVVVSVDDPRAVIRYLRAGGQADVIVYTGDHPLMNALGRFYVRAMSYLSYAY